MKSKTQKTISQKTEKSKTLTKRKRAIQDANKKKLAETKAQIEEDAKKDTIINAKAIEIIKTLKETQGDVNNSKVVTGLYTISTVLAQGKLKRLNSSEKTFNENNVELKEDISLIMSKTEQGNLTKLDIYTKSLQDLYIVSYNKDGDRIVTCTDKKQAKEIENKIAKLNSNNGLPVIQDGIIKLMEYIEKARKIGFNNVPDNYLLIPFEKTIPHSKVYRNGNIKPQTLWRYKNTNAIKETSLEIGRIIENMKSVKEQEKAYIPLETIIENENGDTETITQYKQANMLSVSPVCDINGKEITQTACYETENLIHNILTTINLTDRQAYIFKYYFIKKNSQQEIADKLEITTDNVKKQIKRILEKIIQSGLLNSYGDIEKQVNNSSKQIACYDENGNLIHTFESISLASKVLNIDRGNISKCVNGKLQTVNSLIFKKI